MKNIQYKKPLVEKSLPQMLAALIVTRSESDAQLLLPPSSRSVVFCLAAAIALEEDMSGNWGTTF